MIHRIGELDSIPTGISYSKCGSDVYDRITVYVRNEHGLTEVFRAWEHRGRLAFEHERWIRSNPGLPCSLDHESWAIEEQRDDEAEWRAYFGVLTELWG